MLALFAGLLTAPAAAQTYTSSATFLGAVGTPTYAETFETVPVSKDVIISGFTQSGITYSTPINLVVASPGYNNFGAGLNPTTSTILTSSGDENIFLQLASPMSAVGFDIYYNGMGRATMSFFHDAILLGTISCNGAAVLGYAGFVASPGVSITSAHFVSTGGGQVNTGIDNVVVLDEVVSSVPEPATLPLLPIGLVGLATVRRRRA